MNVLKHTEVWQDPEQSPAVQQNTWSSPEHKNANLKGHIKESASCLFFCFTFGEKRKETDIWK